ncbi:MAG: DUF1573 domain-containing protein [Planctomycetota bacterium]
MKSRYMILTILVICSFVVFDTVVFSKKSSNSTKKEVQKDAPTNSLVKSGDKKSGPIIKFESKAQDLGEVGPGSQTKCEFKFTNTGDDVLKIKKISKTCGCTAHKLKKKEYAPGESGTLEVTYHASSKPSKIKKKIYVNSNDKSHPKTTLNLNGKVVLKIDYEPKNLQLMARKENAACPAITLKSKDKKPFSIKRFQATSQSMSAKFNSSVKKEEYVIQPKVKVEKMGKLTNGRITITVDHPECKLISIPFKITPEFKTQPAGLTLLEVQPGKTITRELWVLSNYNEDFEIESVTSKNGHAKITNQEKDGNRYKIDLEITPPQPSSKKKMFQDKILVKIKDREKIVVSCFGVYAKNKPKS